MSELRMLLSLLSRISAHQVGWVGVCLVIGIICGALSNAINAHICSDFYYVTMGLWDATSPRDILWPAIQEGMRQGGCLGFIIGVVIMVIHRGNLRPVKRGVSVVAKAVKVAALSALGLGLAYALSAWLFPGYYDRPAPLPVGEDSLWLTRALYVEGSIWGWYLGALLAPVVVWYDHWRQSKR